MLPYTSSCTFPFSVSHTPMFHLPQSKHTPPRGVSQNLCQLTWSWGDTARSPPRAPRLHLPYLRHARRGRQQPRAGRRQGGLCIYSSFYGLLLWVSSLAFNHSLSRSLMWDWGRGGILLRVAELTHGLHVSRASHPACYSSSPPRPTQLLTLSAYSALQSCWLCNPIDCSLPGSSVHGIFQARILAWVTISSSKGILSTLV